MTGDLVKAIRSCPQPVICAIDGICAGAGAAVAMAGDLRYGTSRTKTAFLFTRVGLAGADMGACAMLPRLIGQGRASELLFTGRSMSAEEGERWGFLNALFEPDELLTKSVASGDKASGRAQFRARHHQEPVEPGMGHVARCRHRGGSTGTGYLHANRRLRTCLQCLCQEGKTSVQRRLRNGRQDFFRLGRSSKTGTANCMAILLTGASSTHSGTTTMSMTTAANL